jgi:hypothetical protein
LQNIKEMKAAIACLLAISVAFAVSTGAALATTSEDQQNVQTQLVTRCRLAAWQVEIHIARNKASVSRSPTLNADQNACIDQFIQQLYGKKR